MLFRYSNWTWDNPGLFYTSDNGYEPCSQRNNITACLNVQSAQNMARCVEMGVCRYL